MSLTSCTRGPTNNNIPDVPPAKRSCLVRLHHQAVPLEEEDLLENAFKEDASVDADFDDYDSSFTSSMLSL